METPEPIYFLISRYLSGDATAEERASLMKALQEDPGLMLQFDLLQQLWMAGDPAKETDVENEKIRKILQLAAVEEVLEKAPVVEMETATAPRKFRFSKWMAAAVITGIIVSTWAIWQNNQQPIPQPSNEIVAHKGSRTRTLLPDGSIVWLNAGSTLSYDPAFDGPKREIILDGEAFFDIAPQANRPFIVHAGNIDIKVLGTAFNVKSYANDHTVETTLLRGLVQLSRKDKPDAKPILLKPHQKLVMEKEMKEENRHQQKDHIIRMPVQSVLQLDTNLRDYELPETAWIYNRLEFRGDGFPELAKKLERWYNINIHFEDEAVQSLTFNGSLENETVEQAFRALQVAVPFSFTIKGNELFIRSRTPASP
jgi:transmembrane sensor